MLSWFADNALNLVVGAIVLGLVVLCVRNLLPGKHHVGCSGNCAGCSGGCCHCVREKKS